MALVVQLLPDLLGRRQHLGQNRASVSGQLKSGSAQGVPR